MTSMVWVLSGIMKFHINITINLIEPTTEEKTIIQMVN